MVYDCMSAAHLYMSTRSPSTVINLTCMSATHQAHHRHHHRHRQVSGFRYSLLSEPFLLLPEVSAQQLMLQPQQVLGGGAGSVAAAGAARRHEVTVAPTAAGRADCVITWVEYELAPGRWLSYAPHELQVCVCVGTRV